MILSRLGLPFRVFLSAVALVASWQAALAQTVVQPNVQVAARQPGHYFLVIDHSGSMLTPILKGQEAGKTRWALMRERAVGFADRLPEGTEAWAVIFSAKDPAAPSRDWRQVISTKFDSQGNREKFTSQIRSYPEPGPANGTWLYQATDMALDQVEIAGERDPEAFLTILVYTDGVDEGHGRTRAEIMRNPRSQVTRSVLETRIQRLKQRYRNFAILNVYQPGDESIRDAQVVRLQTNRLQLASPIVVPKQEMSLEFAFRDNDTVKLTGRPLTFALESQDGASLPMRLTGGPFQLKPGKLVVGVERTGDWPVGRDISARLRIGYPAIDGSYLVTEGGDSVALFIQGAEAPTIRDLLPAAGSVFPVGRTVSFSLTTLPGASTEWDFGDGKSATGNPVSHAFSEPGKKTVTVKVTDPRTQLRTATTLPIESVRLGIKLDPPPAQLIPENPATFSANAEGEFERFEWNVDGRLYAGVNRKDDRPGTSLTLSFDRPGPVTISVVGEGKHGGRIEAASMTVTIKEVPGLRVTSPASQDTLYFGTAREFRAEVEGVTSPRLRFSLLGPNGEELIPTKEVDVGRIGAVRSGVVPARIPELKGKVAATLRVEAMGASPPLTREVAVTLERESTSLEIMFPDGREVYINRPTALRLLSKAQLKDVRWDFGDGAGMVAGNEIERHTWTRYGDFSVRALARDPDGNEVESTPVAIKVPVRPVTAIAFLFHEGKAVGRDIDRVPIHATLEMRAEVSGDVQKLRWFLDDKELPAGLTSLDVTERGERRLRLVAEGTPQAGSAESTLAFHSRDPFVFWGATAILLLLIALAARLLLGNTPRFTEFHVLTDAERCKELDDGEPFVDAAAEVRWLGPPSDGHACGQWNFFTKRAEISLSKLDNGLAALAESTGYRGFDFAWNDNDCLVFRSGEELPECVGSLIGHNIKVQPVLGKKAMKSERGWHGCWSLDRPGVPFRRPSGNDSGPAFAAMGIYPRLRRRSLFQKIGLDLLFWILFVFTWFAWRELYLIFY